MFAALGEHLDDAVGGVGAVQRRGRGALHDLHALHVFARDVRQAEARDHAVDDDEGILTPPDTRRAAEPQRWLATGLRGIGKQPHAGDFAFDRLQRALSRHRLQLILAHTRDRHRQLAPIRRLRDAGDHDFLEAQRIGRELEVLLLRARREGDRAVHRLVTDVSRRQHHLLAVDGVLADGQGVVALSIRDRAEVSVCHQDVCAAQWLAGLRGDAALDDGLPRERRGEKRCERRGHGHDRERA